MSFRRRSPALLLVAVITSVLTGLAGLSLAAPAQASAGAFVGSINSARANAGLPALQSSGDLASVAAGWAKKMASSGNLSHNPNLKSQVSGWRIVGENVGYGPDVKTIHRALMESPGHRANILDSDYTQVGVGVASADGLIWVAQVFRTPTGGGSGDKPAKKSSSKKSDKKSAAPEKKSSDKKSTEKKATEKTSSSAPKKASGRDDDGGEDSAPRRAAKAAPVAAPPPPPTPAQLLQGRATAAAAGPGAAPAADPLVQTMRFRTVMAAVRG